MEYRQATTEDIPALAELRWEFCIVDYEGRETVSKAEFIAACAEFLRWGMGDGNWHYWLAEDNGIIVANIFVHIIRTVPRPDRLHRAYGYVTNVYVTPEYRNRSQVKEILVRPLEGGPCVPRHYRSKGVGGELLARVQAWAAEQELELLFLWPSERSVPFYLRAGFTPSQELLEFYPGEE